MSGSTFPLIQCRLHEVEQYHADMQVLLIGGFWVRMPRYAFTVLLDYTNWLFGLIHGWSQILEYSSLLAVSTCSMEIALLLLNNSWQISPVDVWLLAGVNFTKCIRFRLTFYILLMYEYSLWSTLGVYIQNTCNMHVAKSKCRSWNIWWMAIFILNLVHVRSIFYGHSYSCIIPLHSV